MKIQFRKMNGAGNDFILIDNRLGGVHLEQSDISFMCERRRGIGADGLILIERGKGCDFHMRYYNSDGGEAEMCANGARCAALFAASLGMGRSNGGWISLRFSVVAGEMEARVKGDHVALSMGRATDLECGISLSIEGREETMHFVRAGVPHAVVEVDDASSLRGEEVVKRGRLIRINDRFAPQGTNVDFASLGKDGAVSIRTYERGVEDETLSCGTGAVAVAVVFSHLGLVEGPVKLVTKGKDELRASFKRQPFGASDVVLEGPAAVNFEGLIKLEKR